MKRIKVIQICQEGVTGYLNGNSCLNLNHFVLNPLDAYDFNEIEEGFRGEKRPKYDLERSLQNLNVRSRQDEAYAKSGVWSDTEPRVLEFDVMLVPVVDV